MASDLNSWSLRENEKRWKAMLKDILERSKKRRIIYDDGIVSDGIKDIKLHHGLILISSTKLLGEYLSICYCTETQEYLVLDDSAMVHRYSMQGKFISPSFALTSSLVVFTRMIWCSNINVLACFVPDDDLMWILTSKFRLIQTVRNEFKIKNIFYLSDTQELLVVGSTIIARYPMQYLDQTLESYKIINLTDEYAGPLWVIHQSSLIHYHDQSNSNASTVRIAGSYLTTIYIFPIIHDDDDDMSNKSEPVKCIAKKMNASSAIITALYFHSTSQWIISGDQQGNVLGWSLTLECTLKCLDGHKGEIKIIISHPSICGFITSSDVDNVLQVWSCNLRQKVETFTKLGTIFSIAIDPLTSSIVTLGTKLNFFYMQQLYTFYAPLTAPATILFSTINPVHPMRIIVGTFDNIIRILSSASGKQLNYQILSRDSPGNTISSIAYSDITKSIYIVCPSDDGNISVSTIETRPMETRKIWEGGHKVTITCIVVYDYYEKIYGSDRKSQHKPRYVNPICVQIMIGTANGEIASIDETTGKYKRSINAHDGAVKKLYASTVSQHVISIGEDQYVKVWRMLPTIVSSLTLIHYIHYPNPLINIASMGIIICIVTTNPTNWQSYQLLMYNFKDKIPLEHHPSKDHSKQILGIATSESLLICATSSEDGTIRVWNQHNDLIKILELSIQVKELTFSSLRGDIVFSAGKHLYRLPYRNYLFAKYREEILNNDISEEAEEKELMIKYDKYQEYENDENEMKILHPVSSVPLGSLDPSANTPCLESILQQHNVAQLKFRDEDIIKIKNGIIHGKRKIDKKKALLNYMDWNKYMDELLKVVDWMEVNDNSEHNVWKSLESYKNINKIPLKFVPNSLIADRPSTMEKTIGVQQFHILEEKDKLKYIYPDELQDAFPGDFNSTQIAAILEDHNNPDA